MARRRDRPERATFVAARRTPKGNGAEAALKAPTATTSRGSRWPAEGSADSTTSAVGMAIRTYVVITYKQYRI